MEAFVPVIVAIVTSIFTLTGTIITCISTARKTEQTFQISQAVLETKMEELTREVRAHNEFAVRLPVLEKQVEVLERDLADIRKKIDE